MIFLPCNPNSLLTLLLQVLDGEAVAWDAEQKKILPFQVRCLPCDSLFCSGARLLACRGQLRATAGAPTQQLSTRKRKDVEIVDIKIQASQGIIKASLRFACNCMAEVYNWSLCNTRAVLADAPPYAQHLCHPPVPHCQVLVYAFDCLYLNGRSLLNAPLTERRAALYSAVKVPGGGGYPRVGTYPILAVFHRLSWGYI